jgi:hypothetical protein
VTREGVLPSHRNIWLTCLLGLLFCLEFRGLCYLPIVLRVENQGLLLFGLPITGIMERIAWRAARKAERGVL